MPIPAQARTTATRMLKARRDGDSGCQVKSSDTTPSSLRRPNLQKCRLRGQVPPAQGEASWRSVFANLTLRHAFFGCAFHQLGHSPMRGPFTLLDLHSGNAFAFADR